MSDAPKHLDDYVEECRALRASSTSHPSVAQHAVCALADREDVLRDRIAALEAQLAERDAKICRLNMEMSVYKQGYTQRDAELVMATIKALEELKQKPMPPPPKEYE